MVWHSVVFIAVAVFLLVTIWRVVSIRRLPEHLRWELSPLPHEKGRAGYGGSHLEEPEFWRNRAPHSLLGVVMYMAKEIIALKGVWKNNRRLWPFSLSLHLGIYFAIATVLFHIVNALLSIGGAAAALNITHSIASILAIIACLLGAAGALGLLLLRGLDASYRVFSTFGVYFRLALLLAVFASGIVAWFVSPDYAAAGSAFVSGLLTLDTGLSSPLAFSLHVGLSVAFLVYLPFTDMVHFIAKFFLYHSVRWNDAPKNEAMQRRLAKLVSRPVDWSAEHIGDKGRTWEELASGDMKHEKAA